jgi:hypothetical protein
MPEESTLLRDAVHGFFSHKAVEARQSLRQLFRVGRKSLVIGLACLVTSIAIGNFVAHALSDNTLGEVMRESLLIGGWVAMWRPLEIFLYDWWPIRAEARGCMTVCGSCRCESFTPARADRRSGGPTGRRRLQDD